MSINAKVVLFFGVILKDDTIPEFDEDAEEWDKSTPAYLAWSGDADETGVGVESFGHHDSRYHAVILARTRKAGREWSALPVTTSEVTPEEAAKIDAFLKKHRLTRKVDRKASKAPGWFVVPDYS